MKIGLKNGNGNFTEVKIGFSWTTVFFNFLVPLIRKDLKWAAIMLLSQSIFSSIIVKLNISLIAFPALIGLNILFALNYNKIYLKERLAEGYTTVTSDGESILRANGYL